jgi:hypothetical protein
MDLKQLHLVASVRRHSAIPWLWRSACTCGEWFLAGTEERARLAIDTHITAEEPFPDIGLASDEKGKTP